MIRWRFVIEGGIDGFSRAVMYLRCSTNNLASTVKDLFMDTISSFGHPLRVRCDHGTQNIAIARWCLEHLPGFELAARYSQFANANLVFAKAKKPILRMAN